MPELVTEIDAARGDVDRQEFITVAIQDALRDHYGRVVKQKDGDPSRTDSAPATEYDPGLIEAVKGAARKMEIEPTEYVSRSLRASLVVTGYDFSTPSPRTSTTSDVSCPLPTFKAAAEMLPQSSSDERRSRGRPPLVGYPEGDRGRNLNARLPSPEYDAFTAFAREHGLSTSECVRVMVRACLDLKR